ncbi:MAG: YqgE/AlgH family protein [Acidimicrobiia bacterium]
MIPGVFVSHRGRLLVATPDLGDPNFDRTVVFLLDHTDGGAVGVVLNRPTDTPLTEAGAEWDGWDALATDPAVVFMGGPVSPTAVICVARADAMDPAGEDATPAPGFQPVLGNIGVVDLSGPPQRVEAVRFFAGYAGWGGGQLEGEVAAGAWFVVDALASDPLGPEPADLWRHVLRRQGGRLSLFAACPPDPSVN